MKIELTNKLLDELKNGKFKDEYLVYIRKSTDEANNQQNSIDYQTKEIQRYILNKGINLAKVSSENFCSSGFIIESHSGYKEDTEMQIIDGKVTFQIKRPKFKKLVELLNKGYLKGIVGLCWDRLSRNDSDNLVLKSIRKSGVDLQFVTTNYEMTSAGDLHQDIDGMMAKHHSRVTSEKVKFAISSLRAKGVYTSKAPIGYLNLGSMENKPIDVPRAKIIKRLFLKAKDGVSLADLTRYANEQGLTTTPRRRPRTFEEKMNGNFNIKENIKPIERQLHKSAVARILSNREYTGMMRNHKDQWIQCSSFEAIIPKDLFEEVQKKLKSRYVSRHSKEKDLHPFRGLMRCQTCERVYTPYIKKGNLYYYSRCPQNCTNKEKSINYKFLDESLKNRLQNMQFTEDELAQLDEAKKYEFKEIEDKRVNKCEEIESKKVKIENEIKYLLDNKLVLLQTGAMSPEEIVTKEKGLKNKLCSLEEENRLANTISSQDVDNIIKFSELLKNLVNIYDFAKPEEKDEIVRKIFSELRCSQKTFTFQTQNGFQIFESRFGLYGGRYRTRTCDLRCVKALLYQLS